MKAIGKCCSLLQHPDQRYRLVTEQTSEGQDVVCHDTFRAQTFCWYLVPFQGAILETWAKCPFKTSPTWEG